MLSDDRPVCFDSSRVSDGCLAIDEIAFILLIKAILAKFGWYLDRRGGCVLAPRCRCMHELIK